jgi:hypothetical protein
MIEPSAKCALYSNFLVIMLTPDQFRALALAMEGAVESAHMGHPDFRANGRIFATLHPGNESGMVKLTPEQQREFLGEGSGAFVPSSGAWGRQGCTDVKLAAVDEDTLGQALTLAWQNTKKQTVAGRKRKQ